MRPLVVRERIGLERDVARSWWNIKPSSILTLENGQRFRVLYNGQPGGPAGPDVRDAVLCLLPPQTDEGESQLVGDVEFHLYASDWFAHGHQDDPRYNGVILHVVYYLDSSQPTRRQDGSSVATCSLLDPARTSWQAPEWPCQLAPLSPLATTSTLLYAGLQRFHARSAALGQLLTVAPTPPAVPAEAADIWSHYDLCLIPELAEGLGYGRDRAFFRAAGLRLLNLPAPVPEPLGRAPEPAPLDTRRLRALRALCARWRGPGAWSTLRGILEKQQSAQAAIAALRAAFRPLGQARTDILIINTLLPFAAAVAALEQASSFAASVQHLYLVYPALPSNRITRMMSAQLQLPQEPARACLQQGLHDIYRRTCRAKNCQDCPCGGERMERGLA